MTHKFVHCYFYGFTPFTFSYAWDAPTILKDYKEKVDGDMRAIKQYKDAYNMYINATVEGHRSYARDCLANYEWYSKNGSVSWPKHWLDKEQASDTELMEFFESKLKEHAKTIAQKLREKKLPVIFVIINDQQENFANFLKFADLEDAVVYRSTKARNLNYLDSRPTGYMQVVILDLTEKEAK